MGAATALIHDGATLERFALQLQQEIGAEHVYLFGSQATGHAKSDSDYDLIIVADSFAETPRIRRGYGIRDLFYEVGGNAPLDLICLTPAEFEFAKGRITLVAAVLPEAIDLLAETTAPG